MVWRDFAAVTWLSRNVSEPLVVVLRRGADPHTLALSGALGFTLGVFPICGVTALLCGFAIGILGPRCNAPTMLVANFVSMPIELSLVVPFLRLGEFVLGGKALLLSKDALWKAVTGRASLDVLLGLCHAFIGWAIAAPFIAAGVYFTLLPITRLAVRRYAELQGADTILVDPLIKDTNVCDV